MNYKEERDTDGKFKRSGSRYCKKCNRADKEMYGTSRYCLDCYKEVRKVYDKRYENSLTRIIAQETRYKRFRAFLKGYKAFAGCVDCGETNPELLDFDHVRGKKKFKVGVNANFSFKKVLKEIAKCEIRCKPCHRARHKRDGRKREG